MRVTVLFSNDSRTETIRGLAALLEALTRIDTMQLAELPPLYSSGVVYESECRRRRGAARPICTEDWRDARETYARRKGDCEDLAAWCAAQFRAQGEEAFALPFYALPNLVHVVVWTPGGIVDPSLVLGMPAIPGADYSSAVRSSLEVLR